VQGCQPFGFVPFFELVDGAFGERRVAMQVVRVEDRADIPKAMPGDRGDLRLGAAGHREPGYGGAAEIMKGQAADARSGTRLMARPRSNHRWQLYPPFIRTRWPALRTEPYDPALP